jgi:hypothetical protein
LLLAACALHVLARRDCRQRLVPDPQHVAHAPCQNAIEQRAARLEAAVQPAVPGKHRDIGSGIDPQQIDHPGNAQRAAHRRPPHLSQGKKTLRTLA